MKEKSDMGTMLMNMLTEINKNYMKAIKEKRLPTVEELIPKEVKEMESQADKLNKLSNQYNQFINQTADFTTRYTKEFNS